MSSQAQILANQANAQLSTGPTSPEGKAVSSKNNLRHGLTGPFMILAWESKEEYASFKAELFAEHQPATLTEEMLVEDMAQSHWLRKRAITLQTLCFRTDVPAADQPKELALYLRYQTTHDRAFYKALNQLLKLRSDKKKAEIGFVSQERKAAEEARRKLSEERKQAQEKRHEAQEIRKQEMHQARLWLTEAQAERHETEKRIAELVKLPLASQANHESALAEAA
jgi:hypothetical protein